VRTKGFCLFLNAIAIFEQPILYANAAPVKVFAAQPLSGFIENALGAWPIFRCNCGAEVTSAEFSSRVRS
jgi:hypothetical protein